MQRRQRGRFAASPSFGPHRQAPLSHIAHRLLLGGDRPLPLSLVCAIMGHEKELLSPLQRSFERSFLPFCSFGNPLSYFVGVNGAAWCGAGAFMAARVAFFFD